MTLQNNFLDVMIGYLDGGCVYPPHVAVVCAASSWTRSSCPPPGPRGATCLVYIYVVYNVRKTSDLLANLSCYSCFKHLIFYEETRL